MMKVSLKKSIISFPYNSLFIHIIASEFYADSKNIVRLFRRPFIFLEMSIFRQKMSKIANLNHFFYAHNIFWQKKYNLD